MNPLLQGRVATNEHGGRSRRACGQNRSAIRQGDVQLQDRAAALVFQGDLNLVRFDVDVLADHLDQLLLQGRQVVRLAALATFVGNDCLLYTSRCV